MFLRSLVLTVILAFCAGFYAGCPQSDGKCESVKDCKAGETCNNGTCQKATTE